MQDDALKYVLISARIFYQVIGNMSNNRSFFITTMQSMICQLVENDNQKKFTFTMLNNITFDCLNWLSLELFLISLGSVWAKALPKSFIHKNCFLQACLKEAQFRCQQCKIAYYCSKEHFESDWEIHKLFCC